MTQYILAAAIAGLFTLVLFNPQEAKADHSGWGITVTIPGGSYHSDNRSYESCWQIRQNYDWAIWNHKHRAARYWEQRWNNSNCATRSYRPRYQDHNQHWQHDRRDHRRYDRHDRHDRHNRHDRHDRRQH
jgi:hypothetical protein